MDWRVLTAIVCMFGFFKELRPSEVYLTEYLTGEYKNLTFEQVGNKIYPWWIYSYILWLIPVFLLTDYLRYKPILIVDGLAFIGTWALLLWAQGVPLMKLMQVTFGLATAGEIGYYSYLYAKVSSDHFMKVASFTRAATLIGKFAAYLTGLLFVSFEIMNFFQLNFISFAGVCVAFLIAMFLPRVKCTEIFLHYKQQAKESEDKLQQSGENTEAPSVEPQSCERKLHSGIMSLWAELKMIYSSRIVILWSLWWALASCVYVVSPHREYVNGAVEAVGSLASSIGVLFIGFLSIDWSVRGRGETLVTAVCAMNAAMLITIAKTTNSSVAYVVYLFYRVTYQVVITIATAQIAKSLTRQRYGFVFGCNMCLALLMETIRTAIVVDEALRTQLAVYGGYFAFMAGLFLIMAIVSVYRPGCRCCDSADITTSRASS